MQCRDPVPGNKILLNVPITLFFFENLPYLCFGIPAPVFLATFVAIAGLPSPSLCPSSLGPAGAMRSPRLQRKKQALSRLRRDSGGLGTRMTASDENNASGVRLRDTCLKADRVIPTVLL